MLGGESLCMGVNRIMNTPRYLPLLVLFSALLIALNTSAQSTTITYQGRFTENGVPHNGSAEMQFTLWNQPGGGALVASNTVTTVAVNVTNGLFVAQLDFGAAAFPGADRWVQIAARTGLGAFTGLVPRQPVTATPYSLTAANVTGTIPNAGLSGSYGNKVEFENTGNTFAGSGAALTELNATQITTGTVPEARIDPAIARLSQVWSLGGNAGTTAGASFLGTSDNQPLEFKVNGQRALRLEPTAIGFAVNVIGGASSNSVAPGTVGATIAGGGRSSFNLFHSISSDYATIGGGQANAISPGATGAMIAGGGFNRIETNSAYAIVGGGQNNLILSNATHSIIAGGRSNTIYPAAFHGTISGGFGNVVSNQYATVVGGYGNTASGHSSLATGAGTIASGDGSTAMGVQTTASGYFSTAMGSYNTASGSQSTAMGISTTASGSQSTAMGFGTTASGDFSTAMGDTTVASAYNSTAMGNLSTAAGTHSTAIGRRAKANHQGSFVWSDSQDASFASTTTNQFSLRAGGGVRFSDDTPALSFGSTGRQMIHLWGVAHGIGVQPNTTYFRTGTRFSWFRGGTHSNAENSAGTGGTVAMTLTSGGLTVNGTFVSSSDRNAKRDFQPVDPLAVLDKVVALPLSEWTYQADEEASRHLGPMAQDFKAAFGLGSGDKHIATVDAGGVALAAIQGLNQKLEQRLEQKETELAELKARLERLEQLLK